MHRLIEKYHENKMHTNTLHKVTGAILMNYIANHYNEEIKHTSLYKQNLKNKINAATKELTKVEKKLFDKVYDIDDTELSDKLSANLITFLDVMIKDRNFPEFSKLQEIVVAYTLDPKAITGISDKILKKNME